MLSLLFTSRRIYISLIWSTVPPSPFLMHTIHFSQKTSKSNQDTSLIQIGLVFFNLLLIADVLNGKQERTPLPCYKKDWNVSQEPYNLQKTILHFFSDADDLPSIFKLVFTSIYCLLGKFNKHERTFVFILLWGSDTYNYEFS